MKPKPTLKQIAIAGELSRWFKKNSRDLPWRRNPEPYFVWLSEIMLQQTQVATVIPYFNRFITQFPKVEDLARASIDEVYQLWAGLGYYSRARNLHKGAQAIAARLANNQGFPQTRAEWLEIPGVGEYTAGAICSIAYNQREAIVDGNVVRVLSRLYRIEKLDAKKEAIWELARSLVQVPKTSPRVFNQAMMELGATVCRPKNPDCTQCPVRKSCAGKAHPEKFPEPKAKKVFKRIEEEKWILLTEAKNERSVFLRSNPEGKWRAGLWDFPDAGSVPGVTRAKLMDQFSVNYVVTTHKVNRKHQVYHVGGAHLKNVPIQGKWFLLDDLPGVPAPVRKAIRSLNRTLK